MYLARERSKKNYVIHSRKHLAFRALRTNASIIIVFCKKLKLVTDRAGYLSDIPQTSI